MLFCLKWSSTNAQLKDAELDYINDQVLFINESIHGALILHRVYEGYNQEVNKYVDLPSYTINQYDNSDLPSDVFEDQTRWFYDKAPNKIFAEITINDISDKVLPETMGYIANIKRNCTNLNQDRKSLEKLVFDNDLNDIANLQRFYESMESVVALYERLAYDVEAYESILMPSAFNANIASDKKQVYTALLEIHLDIKKSIRQIGDDQESGVKDDLIKINKEKNWLFSCINQLSSREEQKALMTIYESINATITWINDYLQNGIVPKEYELYGRGYYYQNVVLLTKTNRYGNGYVSKLNDFFDQYDWSVIHLVEEPHFLKLLYPKLTPKEVLTQLSDPKLTLTELRSELSAINLPELSNIKIETPSETDKRLTANPEKPDVPLKIAGTHVLYVDSLEFVIELYDHLIKDGDRVSINVNGEWLFNDISLEKEPQKIKLSISPDKENFIMIQAVNVGWRPPNTVGVRYWSNGKVENILLKTDLKSTELLEIKYRMKG